MKEHELIIFGGSDFEEQDARKVAKEAGLKTATATLDGKPVHAGNAYQATGFTMDDETSEPLSEGNKVIIFECTPKIAENLLIVLQADHHNPGDTGYGLGAEQFWEASSLGQLCKYLGVEPTLEQLMTAAGDHCPADAYAGRCPGIDPTAFGKFRIQQKLSSPLYQRDEKKNTEEKLTDLIESAKQQLKNASEVEGVKDLRGTFVDELPEAGLSLGVAYMASLLDIDRDRKPTGNTKIVLGGHTTSEAVNKFMEWANALPNKVGNAYGNPTRGFAGVVVKPE
ncbi:MAG: hypothetical protein LBG52_04520 [Candidatus Peribacteria bacterium]|jgi:hypothetical protein|nr:hypothetical protein [Candidatus Peribacteria bacterium]